MMRLRSKPESRNNESAMLRNHKHRRRHLIQGLCVSRFLIYVFCFVLIFSFFLFSISFYLNVLKKLEEKSKRFVSYKEGNMQDLYQFIPYYFIRLIMKLLSAKQFTVGHDENQTAVNRSLVFYYQQIYLEKKWSCSIKLTIMS